MTDYNECSICFHSYNEKDRRPLVLPCSHSFCQSCLETLEAAGTCLCSLCRKSWSPTKVKDLLCCYQLISSGASSQTKDTEQCSDHASPVTMWCDSCSMAICVKCLRLSHKECNWLLIEEYIASQEATYDKAVADLVELVSKNSATLSDMEIFKHTFMCCHDQLVAWQSKAKQELANCPIKTGQDKLKTVALQQKCKALLLVKQASPSDRPASLLHRISKAFQEARNGELETFISELRKIPDPFLGLKEEKSSASSWVGSRDKLPGPTKSHLPLRRSMMEVLVNEKAFSATQNKPFQDGKSWTIHDNASLSAAHGAMRSNLVTPSGVSVQGLDLDEKEMSDFLSLVSKTRCRLSLKLLDTFWRPSRRILLQGYVSPSMSILTTRSTLFPLMKPGVRCVVTEFWGHLDEDCLVKLPPNLQSVGLTLIDKEDMAAVNRLVKADGGAWLCRQGWRLGEIHISIARRFSASFWKLLPTSRGLFSPSTSHPPSTNLALRLHFPKIEVGWSDVTWLKEVLSKVTAQITIEGILRDVYLPDTQVTPASLQSIISTYALTAFTSLAPVTVHFASNYSDQSSGGPRRVGKCLFKWDIDN